jgi:hypothetical protein
MSLPNYLLIQYENMEFHLCSVVKKITDFLGMEEILISNEIKGDERQTNSPVLSLLFDEYRGNKVLQKTRYMEII